MIQDKVEKMKEQFRDGVLGIRMLSVKSPHRDGSAAEVVEDPVQLVAEGVSTVKKFAKRNAETGRWPDSEAAIWAWRSGAPQNGFEAAFITIGRRVLIVEKEFWRAVASCRRGQHV